MRGAREPDVRIYFACGAHSGTSNTDTKLLINGLFQKGGVLAQDGEKQIGRAYGAPRQPSTLPRSGSKSVLID